MKLDSHPIGRPRLRHRSIAKALCLLVFLAAGCAKKKIIKKEEAPPPPPSVVEKAEQDDIEASIRGKDFTALPEIQIIYFDLDSSELRPEMREAAAQNAEFLKAHPNIIARVDGHCDIRGSTEYNLALGQRRAAALRAYYKSLGVPGNRMGSQSWGEEKPPCAEDTTGCWSRSRRAETMVQLKETPAQAAPSQPAPKK